MTYTFRLFLIFSFIFSNYNAFPQNENFISPSGGGKIKQDLPQICMTKEFENELHQRLEKNRSELVTQGILKDRKELSQEKSITKFEWPLKQASGFNNPSYYDIQNFVDLNAGSGILDYNCGERSYDGHNGIDIDLWPFWWNSMENDQVEVVAGAFGTIIGKDDGNFDMNCSCEGNWNAVYVEHPDGTRVYYGHLKKNTLTTKQVGSNVQVGDYIGIVGSSGCSSNPHLHLEFREVDQSVIEPFQGNCNSTVDESWWVDQLPYRDPTVNALFTHDDIPGLNGFCPEDEATNFKNTFTIGELAYMAAYYHDQEIGSLTQYKIIDALDNVVESWSFSSPDTYTRSYWYWNYNIPNDAVEGEWIFEAEYNGQTSQHKFNVSLTSSLFKPEMGKTVIFPNPASDYLSIKAPRKSDYHMSLINIEGKRIVRVKYANAEGFEIDVSAVDCGVYFIELLDINSNAITIHKFIKTNVSN
jgi:hypothetical protein